jgi:hypothetical protein
MEKRGINFYCRRKKEISSVRYSGGHPRSRFSFAAETLQSTVVEAVTAGIPAEVL